MDDLDARVAAGILTAERRDLLRLERQVQQLGMDLSRAEQRRAKTNGHVEAARKRIGEVTREVGRKLQQLGVEPADAAKLSMPIGGAMAELTLAAEELRPAAPPALQKPAGKLINLGVRLKLAEKPR